MLCSGLIKYSTTWSVTSVAAAAANLNVMFLLWLKLSATYILLPQQPNLNVIERKFKRQILKPDPIILALSSTADNCQGGDTRREEVLSKVLVDISIHTTSHASDTAQN